MLNSRTVFRWECLLHPSSSPVYFPKSACLDGKGLAFAGTVGVSISRDTLYVCVYIYIDMCIYVYWLLAYFFWHLCCCRTLAKICMDKSPLRHLHTKPNQLDKLANCTSAHAYVHPFVGVHKEPILLTLHACYACFACFAWTYAMYACMYVRMSACMYVCLCLCTCCVYVCMYICMYYTFIEAKTGTRTAVVNTTHVHTYALNPKPWNPEHQNATFQTLNRQGRWEARNRQRLKGFRILGLGF